MHRLRSLYCCSLKMKFLPVKTLIRSLATSPHILEELNQFIKHANLEKIEQNIILRKHNNNIPFIRKLIDTFTEGDHKIAGELKTEILKLPNETHPRLCDYGEQPKELEQFTPGGSSSSSAAIEFSELSKYMNVFRMDHLGNYTGHKSYYLFGPLAEMEQAIKQYTVKELCKNNFQLISVPDILPKSAIEGCGMQTGGERTQVYKLDSGLCLSGTSEMALAAYFENKLLKESELPIKVAAVSRCYRAETSGLNEEKGIYRVHQFTKVEMFSICSESQSEAMLELFKNLQLTLFKKLKLKFRLLDMPPFELGAPAYQKYDIEAWMPGRKQWGEISSCSNCTDYQAKRLNIKYTANNGEIRFAHTVNGTAAAVPRLLIALLESGQSGKQCVNLPEVIADYMSRSEITKEKRIPEIKLMKNFKKNL